MKIIIPKDKLNKRYYVAIWFALIFVSLLKNLPIMYYEFAFGTFNRPIDIVLNIFLDLIAYGVFPSLLCFICSMFLCSTLWRRGIVLCSRNDFIYYGMIFTGASRLVIGFINIFAIIEPIVFDFTSSFFDEIFLTLAIYLMGIVLMKKYYGNNDKKIYAAYQNIGPIYFVFLGLDTLLPAISNLVVYLSPNVNQEFSKLMEVYMGTSFEIDYHMYVASIIAIVLFVVILIINGVVGMLLKKNADKCTEVDKNIIMDDIDNNHHDDSPFEEFRNDNHDDKDNVFDEFDL